MTAADREARAGPLEIRCRALRSAGKHNPRNRPCPTCKEPDMLTPADVERGYQCDACADQAERGY